MFLVSLVSCCYYLMLVAYCVYYTAASLARHVPWRHCDNPWNTEGRFRSDVARTLNALQRIQGVPQPGENPRLRFCTEGVKQMNMNTRE